MTAFSEDEEFNGGGELVHQPNNLARVLRALGGEFPADPSPLLVTVPAPPFLEEIAKSYEEQALHLSLSFDKYCMAHYGVHPREQIKRAFKKPVLMGFASYLNYHKITPAEWYVFSSYVWHTYMKQPANLPPTFKVMFDVGRVEKHRGWARSELRLFPQRLLLNEEASHYLVGYGAARQAAQSGDVKKTRAVIQTHFPHGWERVYNRALADAKKRREQLALQRQAGEFLWK